MHILVLSLLHTSPKKRVFRFGVWGVGKTAQSRGPGSGTTAADSTTGFQLFKTVLYTKYILINEAQHWKTAF